MVRAPAQTRSHTRSAIAVSSVAPHQVGEPAEEQRLAAGQLLEDRGALARYLQRLGQQHRCEIGRDEADPAVAARQATGAGPQHLAGAGELVEHRGG